MLITTMIMAELIHNITELTLVWNCIHNAFEYAVMHLQREE